VARARRTTATLCRLHNGSPGSLPDALSATGLTAPASAALSPTRRSSS